MEKRNQSRSGRTFHISKWVPYIILICLLIFMNFYQPGLLNFRWLNRQADAWVTLALVAVGQTLVFMIGGTDLSVGGIICFTNCLAALYMPESVPGMIGMSVAVILVGTAAGVFNGFIIVKLKLQPFIATLATWAIWYGAALCLLSTDGGKVPAAFSGFFIRSFPGLGGVRVSTLILLGLIAVGIFFKASSMGIAVRAIGSNEKGAYFGGINITAVKIKVYALSGMFAGMSGLFRTAQVNSGSPTAGNDFILLSCASAVIGGCSGATGHFSFAGAVAGAATMRILTSLMVTAGVSSYMTSVFQGLILIVTVCINSFSDIARERKRMEVSAK